MNPPFPLLVHIFTHISSHSVHNFIVNKDEIDNPLLAHNHFIQNIKYGASKIYSAFAFS
jgi:hypothetical protein